MSRSSNRLRKSSQEDHPYVKAKLKLLIDQVVYVETPKQKIRNYIAVIQYILSDFDNILRCFRAYSGENKCVKFLTTAHNKSFEIIRQCEQLIIDGIKVKMLTQELKRYCDLYTILYTKYKCQDLAKIVKQLCINRLPLCCDVVDIIKSYCFQDKKTVEYIKNVKECKQHIVTLIDFARSSRKNGFDRIVDTYHNIDIDPDEHEFWTFCIDEDEVTIQSINCKICGNYWAGYSPGWAPYNILCNCEHNE